MRKLSEICGEDALDFLADIVEEVAVVCEDDEFVELARTRNKMGMIKCLLRNHKAEVLNILACLNDTDMKEFRPSVVEIPKMLIELFNDPDLASLFISQDTVASSGSATESTEETEKK